MDRKTRSWRDQARTAVAALLVPRRALPARRFGTLGVTPYLRAAVLAALAVSAPAAGQAAPDPPDPLPADHWGYALLDALDAADAADGAPAGLRPAQLGAVRAALLDAGGDDRLARAARRWAERLDRDRSIGATAAARLTLGVRDGDAWLDPGGGTFAAVDASVRPMPGLALWGRYDTGGRERFDGLDRLGLSAALGPAIVHVGRQRLMAAGPAPTSSALGGSVPLDAIEVVSRNRGRPGLIGGITGPMGWRVGLARWNPVGDADLGWILNIGLVAEPIQDLRLGVSRVVAFGGANTEPFTAARLFRMLISINNRPVGWDDNKFEYHARYDWRLWGQPFAAYVVIGQEDMPPYRDPGLLAGLSTPLLTPAGLLRLRYDYSAYGRRARWCPFCAYERGLRPDGTVQGEWYTHIRNGDYAREGIPLGDPLGGYGAAHTLGADLWSDDARWHADLAVFLEVREEGNLLRERWPGWRRGVEAGLAWELGDAFELTLRGLVAGGAEIGTQGAFTVQGTARVDR